MTIERDKWLHVHTTTPDRAREFFGLPPNTEVRLVRGRAGEPRCYAVRPPEGATTQDIAQLRAGPPPLDCN